MAVYTVFGQTGGAPLQSDPTNYTMGMQFTLSQSAALTGIWFNSPTGATDLPIACCIYQITGTNTGSQVTGTVNTSPSWSAAAGSGWIKVTYNGSVTLSAGTNYRVCIEANPTGNFYGVTANYWSSGAGGSGITSGIITAPQSSAADGSNQDAFITPSSGLQYPTSSFNSGNYWVDVEVTTAAGGGGAGTVPLPLVSPVKRRTAARSAWRGFISHTTNAPPPPPLAQSNAPAVPGYLEPGYAQPGNPLLPSQVPVVLPLPTRVVGGRMTSRTAETYRFSQ